MECPNGHAGNRDDSRFCSNCATPLSRGGFLDARSGTPLPMMKKLIILGLTVLCPFIAVAAQEGFLVGYWRGVIQAGGRKFTFVFTFSADSQKGIQGSLDLPEQSEQNIPVDEIKVTENKIYLDMKRIQRKYEGEIGADKNRIVGLYIRSDGTRIPLTLEKTDSAFSMKRPQMPRPPYPYKEDPIVIVNTDDQTKLAGTLTIPDGAGPFPAIILISGSGAQDRDETVFGHKPFLVLADYLARWGAAVLRCDDRGAGESGGEHLAATTAVRAADVGWMIDDLLARKEIDRKRIFLLGHSEGSVIAGLAASRKPLAAGIILLGAPGLSIEENLYLQNTLLRKAEGASDAAIAQANILQRRIFSVVKEVTDDEEARAKLRGIYSSNMYERLTDGQKKSIDERIATLLTPYFRDIIKSEPSIPLSKVTCPVLVIIGEKDLQCPPKDNIPALEKALRAGGNQKFRVIEMDGLNHLLQRSTSGSMSEYASIEETISPQALTAISDWLLSIKQK
jgi:pimeloyl-ACP methyl ester carboxylesterase